MVILIRTKNVSPPEVNIEPENGVLEEEIRNWNPIIFRLQPLIFGGVFSVF